MPFELRIVPQICTIDEAAWNALLGEESSPFVEHAWLDSLEQTGCVGEAAGWFPRHLALYEGDQLIAAAPAYLKINSEGEFVFDWSWAELASRLGIAYYPKLVVAVPFTPATGDRVLVHPSRDRLATIAIMAEAVKSVVNSLELSSAHVLFPREEEARAWCSGTDFAMRHGVQFHWSNAVPKFANYEAFLATLPQKKRTQIRRERKQPALDGVVIATVRPEEYTRELAGEMHELYTLTVDKYFAGRRYLTKAFFEQLVERFRSRLAWVVARRDGELIAGAFNVKKNGILYGRYWGAHTDMPFLHFNVCYYHGVEEAIREGLSVFNPGAGGEHKKVRGFEPTLTYSAHYVRNARFRSIVDDFLTRERSHVAAYIEQERSSRA